MKNIDWEQFIMNTLANNFVLHMRIYKKAKEKLKIDKQNGVITTPQTPSSLSTTAISNNNPMISLSSSLNSNSSLSAVGLNGLSNDELYLIDYFFDIEADLERGICRDEISHNSNGKEMGMLN